MERGPTTAPPMSVPKPPMALVSDSQTTCAQLKRSLAVWRSEGVIDDNANVLSRVALAVDFVGDPANALNVDEPQVGINRGFKIHHPRLGSDGCPHLRQVGHVHQRVGDPEPGQPILDQ